MGSRARDWQNYFLGGIFFVVLCLTFTDVKLVLKILLSSNTMGIVVEQGVVALLLVLQVYCLFKRKHSRYVYFFLFITCWQISIYLAKGYGLIYVFMALANDCIFLIYLAWFERKGWTRRGIIKVFVVAVSVHFVFIILELLGVTSAIVNEYSGYGDDNIQNGYRYTGLFVAPGVLGFFSAFMAVYGAADYKINRDYLGLFVFVISLMLGIASGNRSFILAATVGLLAVYAWRPRFPNYKKTKTVHSTILIALAISLIVTPLFVYQDEIQFILDRYKWENLLTDIIFRSQGKAGFLPALQSLGDATSIFGTTSIDPERGSNGVLFEGQFYTLNNSYSSVLATKGWLFGGAYLMLYFGALFKYRRMSKSCVYSEVNAVGSCVYFAMFAASIVLVFDNLIEGVMMQSIVLLAYSRMWGYEK